MKIFYIFVIPLLAIMVFQSVFTYGTVSFGGVFSILREYSVGRLEQVTETRRITLENNMNRQWTNFAEEYELLLVRLEEMLEDKKLTAEEFLSDDEAMDALLKEMTPTWIYMMRKNVVNGAFIILGKPEIEDMGGETNGFYLRDEDATANSADYSDISLLRGSSEISKEYKIPLGTFWAPKFKLSPASVLEADNYFYKPYVEAKKGELSHENLGYWSNFFCVEGDGTKDGQHKITYSMPLITSRGEVIGVMGIDISEKYLNDFLPYQEVDTEHRGGYLLLRKVNETQYYPVLGSGAMVNRELHGNDLITLVKTKDEGTYRLGNKPSNESVFLTLSPIRVYNSNTPFYNESFLLAGVEHFDALYGFEKQLSSVFILAVIASLIFGVICVLLIVQYVTKPIRRLSMCIRGSKENLLLDFEESKISEVDELYNALWNLTDQQKKSEYRLMQEKERYRVALQSSSDILFTYDTELDVIEFYNLDGQGDGFVVENLKQRIESGEFCHPDSRHLILSALAEQQKEITFTFRSRWFDTDRDYQWFELRGRLLHDDSGEANTLIGALRNVNAQKIRELEGSHLDAMTGLLNRNHGEKLIREIVGAGGAGTLVAMDVRKFLNVNEQFGMVVADTILEELGRILLEWKGIYCKENTIILRQGGDEFLAWLDGFEKDDTATAINNLTEMINDIYPVDRFHIMLSIGADCNPMCNYDMCLKKAYKALACSKETGGDLCFYENIPPDFGEVCVETQQFNVIEHTSALEMNTISLTFAFFDKSHEIRTVLAILFPKLSREYSIDYVVYAEANQDFFTTQGLYCWPASAFDESAYEVKHYVAAVFDTLTHSPWDDNGAYTLTPMISSQERDFFHISKEQDGVVFPLFDNGVYMGSLAFLRPENSILWSDEVCKELYEIVKIIESNVNRARHDLASKAKSDFLSRMSHEIRTPMNAIIGMTLIAQTHKNDPVAIGRDLHKIDQSSKYLLGLINDILDMAKIESGKMALLNVDFHLMELVNSVGDLIRPGLEDKQILYKTEIEVLSPWVKGDYLHLHQVLLNLMSNAVKFTGEGGEICLRVKQESDGKCSFSVQDNGIGVSPENASRIFQSFEQAEATTTQRFGGTGLGLAISSKLIRMMDGNIVLESEVGKGSIFSFTILLEAGIASDLQVVENVNYLEKFGGKHILLVEDNLLNVEISKTILEMYGFVIEVAYDGQEAVDQFGASSLKYFDAILMDIHMPRMDGLEATKCIRRMEREDAMTTPIIAMTANAFDVDMRKSVESGMNGHLAKPIEVERLLQALSNAIK